MRAGSRGPGETTFRWGGDMWECPDFFPIGDKHVLIYSTQGKTFWHADTLDTAAMIFHPERDGILDNGSFYAPKTQLDPHDRRILWGWIREACGEVVLSFRRSTEPLEFSLASHHPANSWLICRYDPSHPGEIRIDNQPVPLGPGNDAPIELRFLIDGSVIECFANGYGALTRRFDYAGDAAPTIGVHVNGPLNRIASLSVNPIKPISTKPPDNLDLLPSPCL